MRPHYVSLPTGTQATQSPGLNRAGRNATTRPMAEIVTISLLDPVRGDATQHWEFEGATLIRFGRGATNDVVLGDEEVSRLHGEFARSPEGWTVTPLGRNGVAISGHHIAGVTPVGHTTVLRLSANGPYIEFRIGRRPTQAAQRLADRKRFATATREREQERQRARQTNATQVDFLKRQARRNPSA